MEEEIYPHKPIKIINGHTWLSDVHVWRPIWTSNWLCPDSDCATAYINDVNKFVNVYCFSGIETSFIQIDVVDFISFWHRAGYKEPMDKLSFTEQCLYIADWLCSKYCKYYGEEKI